MSEGEAEPLFSDEEILAAFKDFDKGGRGYIGVSDIKKLFQRIGIANLTDEEVSAMVDVLDVDGVGRVGYDMFKKMALLPVDDIEVSRPNTPGSVDNQQIQNSLSMADGIGEEPADPEPNQETAMSVGSNKSENRGRAASLGRVNLNATT